MEEEDYVELTPEMQIELSNGNEEGDVDNGVQ